MGAFGGCLGLVYFFLKKIVYIVILIFVLEDEKFGVMGGVYSLVSFLGFDLGGGGGSIFIGFNLIELFKFCIMIEKILLIFVIVNGKEIFLVEMYI